MMKINTKIFGIAALLIAALLLAPSLQAYPVGVANVDSGCTCHSGTASNDVSPFMTLGNGSALPSEYVAGETYTLSFGFTGGPGAEDNPTRVNTGGFNLVASNGELTTLDDATKLMAGQLTHTESGNDQMNWTVEWTAPSSGDASFQLTVNSVNGDGSPSGDDHWAQSTFTMDEENKKEVSEHINLKVIGQDGSVVHFKIKKNTPLRKLMTAYCDRTGVKVEALRFRFDGQPINETDTPTQIDMEDGDSIDVFQQQTGGTYL